MAINRPERGESEAILQIGSEVRWIVGPGCAKSEVGVKW